MLAKAYDKLPSEIADNATTFDLMVMDVMVSWENYKRDPNNMENYKTEDLEEMLRRTRE